MLGARRGGPRWVPIHPKIHGQTRGSAPTRWVLGGALHVQLQFYWAVVTAEDVGVDAGIEELWAQPLGDDEIVDAPACVLLPCLESV